MGRNRTRDPRVPEPKRTPLGYILPIRLYSAYSYELHILNFLVKGKLDRALTKNDP
jgi:hypothetical protein